MRSRGETQDRGCDLRVGCDPGLPPQRAGSKSEDSVAFRRRERPRPKTVGTGTSGIGKKPMSVGAQAPPHPQERATV